MQDDFIHKQLFIDTDSIYRLSCHPLYLLLSRLILFACKESLCCLEVCLLTVFLRWMYVVVFTKKWNLSHFQT